MAPPRPSQSEPVDTPDPRPSDPDPYHPPMLKRCNETGCRKLIDTTEPFGRCTIHAPLAAARTRARDAPARAARARAHGRSSSHWQTLRVLRLELDGYLCTFRLDGCTTIATTVHLDPERGGDHREATLEDTRSACRHCHGVVDGGRARPRSRA